MEINSISQTPHYSFKIIWGKQYIGIAIDKILNRTNTFPITTFFFWPKENGWELLKTELLNKPWITKEDRIEILNGYNQIIKYWLTNVNQIKNIPLLITESSIYNFELSAIDF